MLRILSWSSGLGCDTMHGPEFNMFVPKQQLSPVATEFPLSPTVKRKRSPSSDEQTTMAHSRNTLPEHCDRSGKQAPGLIVSANVQPESLKQESLVHGDAASSPHAMHKSNLAQQADADTQPCSDARLQTMRQTISAQLSLEILLKHKELRLIDQELAKCQVALEQLRRCTEIPFPGTQQPLVSVSNGHGPAVRKAGERNPAASPAPWGVVDGPYARHYAKWLLPDHRFDGGEPETVYAQTGGKGLLAGRTRGSVVETPQSQNARSRGGNLQSLPAGYAPPKEKATGPMILKRKSDGVMVKLVCPDCSRHDFGSAQGFINHCRIGHQRSFASHDAAAEACGQPVEYDENGTIKGAEPVKPVSSANVHPLIRSAKLMSHSPSDISLRGGYTNGPRSHRRNESVTTPISPDFQASLQTPHLSALVKNKGLGLNLQDLVSDAKIQTPLPESDGEDDEMELDSPAPFNASRHPQVAGSKQPVKSGKSKAPSVLLQSRMRLGESTSTSDVDRRLTLSRPSNPSVHVDMPPPDSFNTLIPSPTNESTQAPSLVDDDEDFDPQSPLSSDGLDEAEVDFAIQDDEHSEQVSSLRDELPPQNTCAPASTATRTHTRRLSGMRQTSSAVPDNKNTTFVSPSPCPEGSDRKRRKIEES